MGPLNAEANRSSKDAEQQHALAQQLERELRELERFGESHAAVEARQFVRDMLDRLMDAGSLTAEDAKGALYSSKSRRRMSSAQHWVGDAAAPDFIKPKGTTPKPPAPQSHDSKTSSSDGGR